MNHCRRCDSDYEKPGTCNCFAEKVAPLTLPIAIPFKGAPPTFVPVFVPGPPPVPITVSPYPVTPTITWHRGILS